MADTREINVTLGGRDLTVPVKRDRRARRITIHVDAAIGGARVVMPVYVAMADAEAAIREHERWVLDRLDALPPRIPFADGSTIPVRGRDHRIRHVAGRRGVVTTDEGVILTPGDVEHLPRRIADWLKKEARRTISPLALEKAAMVDRRVRQISIRDQRSRWGSCAANGRLSFSWRLILAPEDVLDYVVAHEVAHLVEMNHSQDFWRVVDRLTPHARSSKRWLSVNGQGLHRYG